MSIWNKLYQKVFGCTIISVGHGAVPNGKITESAVVLFVGRRFVALSPEGARKIADQLKVWADHADAMGRTTHAMKWIVKISKKPAEADVMEWAAAGAEAASAHISQVLGPTSPASGDASARGQSPRE